MVPLRHSATQEEERIRVHPGRAHAKPLTLSELVAHSFWVRDPLMRRQPPVMLRRPNCPCNHDNAVSVSRHQHQIPVNGLSQIFHVLGCECLNMLTQALPKSEWCICLVFTTEHKVASDQIVSVGFQKHIVQCSRRGTSRF